MDREGPGWPYPVGVVPKNQDVRDFLSSRRARLTPEQVGLPRGPGPRRVPGLRREEVASLAGVSADYYTRLEKGNLAGVSEGVLESVARALALDEAERQYLLDLSRGSQQPPAPDGSPQDLDVPADRLETLLRSLGDAIAVVYDPLLSVVGTTPAARQLFAPVLSSTPGRGPDGRTNLARYLFLDPDAGRFFLQARTVETECVAILRGTSARSPEDRALHELIADLGARSTRFRALWSAHEVSLHADGIKAVSSPSRGPLDLHYEVLSLQSMPGLTLTLYMPGAARRTPRSRPSPTPSRPTSRSSPGTPTAESPGETGIA